MSRVQIAGVDARSHQATMPERVGTKRLSAILALQRDLRGRLVSGGGRPSDPAPTIRRLVTVKKQVWKDLQSHATLLSRLGGRVSPGQLAAMLLEKSVSSLGPPPARR
jgi:hypothetical protein